MGRRDLQNLDLVRRLRTNAPGSEAWAWSILRDRRCHGFKFRRQHPLHGRIIDFWCHQLRLAIEIDGASHIGREAHDRQRDDALARHGIATCRIRAGDVDEARLRAIVAERARELRLR